MTPNPTHQPVAEDSSVAATERKPPTPFGRGFKGEHKRMVNKAIRHNSKGKEHHVMLTYRKEDGSESTRKVTPYTTKKDVFIAKDHSRDGQLRSFKLERIIKMEKTAFELGFEKQALLFGRAKKEPVAPPTSVIPHPGNYAGGGTNAMGTSSSPHDAIKAQRNARRQAEMGSKLAPAAPGGAAPAAPAAGANKNMFARGFEKAKGMMPKTRLGKGLLAGGAVGAVAGGAMLAHKILGGSKPQPQQQYGY